MKHDCDPEDCPHLHGSPSRRGFGGVQGEPVLHAETSVGRYEAVLHQSGPHASLSVWTREDCAWSPFTRDVFVGNLWPSDPFPDDLASGPWRVSRPIAPDPHQPDSGLPLDEALCLLVAVHEAEMAASAGRALESETDLPW